MGVKSWVRKILIVVGVLVCVKGLCLFAEKATGSFTIARITSNLAFNPAWEMEPEKYRKVESIVKQKFFYLDRGGQSWVFISEDGQYVAKFFKFRFTWYDLCKKLWLPNFLEPYRPHLTNKQLKKREGLLGGYALAYARLREEALLEAVFLNGKNKGQATMRIVDKLGNSHTISLHNKPFILQRTAVPLVKHLAPLMKEGRVQEAKNAICSALNLIAQRCSQGIIDEDHRLYCNLGFVGKQAVYLDAGSLREDFSVATPERSREEILRAADLLIGQLEQESHIAHVL
jgi:hypothetical protein